MTKEIATAFGLAMTMLDVCYGLRDLGLRGKISSSIGLIWRGEKWTSIIL